MSVREQLLDDLADAVLDGATIDWAEAESGAGPQSRLLRHLRLIESIAELHRNALSDASLTSSGPVAISGAMPETWGHLRLLERVGRGAFGQVFRAWDTRLDREVALKLLAAAPSPNDADAGTIIHEGRLLARVRHSNVVTIHGAEQIGDQIGLWMEFVRGQTLEQLLRQGKVFTGAEVIKIGLDLSGAVSAVHAAGLLHRDIKAHNVTRADDGRIVLMDFGTGRELDDNSSSDLAGTPLYLAPEVMAGQPATVQSDIYSLGVLLYHLLTSAYPVTGRTMRDVRRAHERHERVALRTSRPDVRPGLARVIERAIDPQPERRHPNVEALARDLAALQRRPAVVRFVYGLAATASVVLVTMLAAEIHARVSGDRRTLRTRMASLMGVAPSYLESPVIAVLPFKNYSNDPDRNLLVDSVTAGLIDQLSNIEGLQATSQTSSFMLKDLPHDLADIGRRLNVNLVVEGDAQISGQSLIINAALVSISNERRIWQDKFTRPLSSEGDVVAVVEELTRKIVDQLRLKLGRTQRQYKTDIATYELYLKGRAVRDRRLGQSANPIALFEEVIRKEPSYGPAWAALAAAYGSMTSTFPDAGGRSISPAEAATLMEPLKQKALEIDPTLAEAHAAQGYLYTFSGQWEKAEAAFRQAIYYQPGNTSLYGDLVLAVLLPWGKFDEAVSTMTEAMQRDPLSLDARRVLIRAQTAASRVDDALDNCKVVREQNPDYPFVEEACGLALMLNGQMAAALELFTKRPQANEHFIGYVYAKTGRQPEAQALAARNAHLPQRQAMIYAALGDKDRAFEALERLAALNPRRAAFYLNSQELAALRDDPRAAAFMQKLGFSPR